MKANTTSTRFEVDLGSIELPPLVAGQIEADIRSTVLTALARLDQGGLRRIDWKIRYPWGGVWGMILDPRWPQPWPQPWPMDEGLPDITDHEIIMRAVMDHADAILKALGYRKGDPKPSGEDVLRAALAVDQVGRDIQSRIGATLGVLDRIGGAEPKLPSGARKAMKAVAARVSGRPIEEQVALLSGRDLMDEVEDAGVIAALPFAARILSDGAGTIYDPSNPFIRRLSAGQPQAVAKDKVDGLKDTDYLGGVAGGAAGTVVPGVGTAAGAAGGAAAASAGYAIAWLIDTIF